MNSRIYKSVHFDASHRLMHYHGKCAHLHGHRWRVEVWMEGEVDNATGILVDYNTIKSIIERFDHQTILNRDDPMVPCIGQFQPVITTPGDPTSELLAGMLADMLDAECRNSGISARVVRIRVWESDTCFAELRHEGH
jgi:6-pyruvoyltetrahydropterin/6-carboxytetrahydropterin synthase